MIRLPSRKLAMEFYDKWGKEQSRSPGVICAGAYASGKLVRKKKDCVKCYPKRLTEEMEQCVENLKDKRDKFIGSLENNQTMIHSDGFKNGLSWAIDSIETHIRLANCQAQGEGEK